jgi:hypothetical protein
MVKYLQGAASKMTVFGPRELARLVYSCYKKDDAALDKMVAVQN